MNDKLAPELTCASCLTPAGIGAIAVLAVRGPRAWDIVRSVFRPRSRAGLPDKPVRGPVWLGKIDDDVVLSVKSLEPWPWVEIHCHGGLQVIQLIMDQLTELGATQCAWAEFTRHAERTHLRADAAIALGSALTARTAAILLDQYQGAWDETVARIVSLCAQGEHQAVGSELAQLNALIDVGLHLTKPRKVVVAGAVNVGKSSLVNALVGYERCIVAPTPGTTRDVVTTTIALGGWPVALADTAGFRDPEGPVEQEGMRLARGAVDDADCCIWVVDASQKPIWPASRTNYLLVINKIDLAVAWPLDQGGEAVRVSARTGEGLPQLVRELTRRLVPMEPVPGLAVPFMENLGHTISEAVRLYETGDLESVARLLRATVGKEMCNATLSS